MEWVDWFDNHGGSLEPIGNMPPVEAEERYYAMLEQPAMSKSNSNHTGLRQTRGGSVPASLRGTRWSSRMIPRRLSPKRFWLR